MNPHKIRRPVLRYHGGKWRLGKWIISFFPKHRIYTESFGGGASVLIQKPRSYAEVYNDLNKEVVNVFKVLRDNPDELERLIRLTPYSRVEFENTGKSSLDGITSDVELARRTIFRAFSGFGSASVNSKYSTGFRSNSNRSSSIPAHDWANYPDYIHLFTERLKGVVIDCRDAFEVMDSNDTPETLHYVDPPYVRSTSKIQWPHGKKGRMKKAIGLFLQIVFRNHSGAIIWPSQAFAICKMIFFQNETH